MKLLAIDTATENCSVGLSLPGRDIELLEAITPAGHSKLVHGMIRQLLDRHNMDYPDLDGIVVDTGPGSFTGVRIGIGVAQGLAYAGEIPVLGVSSLQALAAATDGDYCLAAIDARMQQVYWALYRYDSGIWRGCCDPLVTDPAELCELVEQQFGQIPENTGNPGQILGAGSGWDSYPAELKNLKNKFGISKVQPLFPSAQGLLSIAMQEQNDEGSRGFIAAMDLTATYVRDAVAAKQAV